MRSFDYCHFEVVLGGTINPNEPDDVITAEYVDALRKKAARLADKAVEQYKIAKANAEKIIRDRSNREYDRRSAERIRKIAESDRSESDQAFLKAFDDSVHESRVRNRYDYEDDWSDHDEDED